MKQQWPMWFIFGPVRMFVLLTDYNNNVLKVMWAIENTINNDYIYMESTITLSIMISKYPKLSPRMSHRISVEQIFNYIYNKIYNLSNVNTICLIYLQFENTYYTNDKILKINKINTLYGCLVSALTTKIHILLM